MISITPMPPSHRLSPIPAPDSASVKALGSIKRPLSLSNGALL